MAMVLNYYIDDSITPIQIGMFSKHNGHRTRNNGTSWTLYEDMAKEFDLEFKQTASKTEALNWMKNKNEPLIICSMGRGHWTSSGHMILLYDIANGIAYINDPNSTELKREKASFNLLASECCQFFCFNYTKEKQGLIVREKITVVQKV